MNGMPHEYLIQVFQSFLYTLRMDDGEYFNDIPDEDFHIIYGSQDTYSSRKGKRIVLKNKKYAKKRLFAPYNYTMYIINSFCLSGNFETHPEAPKLYLDAFLIDSTLDGYQRVYLLLGNNSDNTIIIKSYDKFSDGRVMSIGGAAPVDWAGIEHDLISFVDIFISSLCEITSKCKLQRIKSIVSLEEAVLC